MQTYAIVIGLRFTSWKALSRNPVACAHLFAHDLSMQIVAFKNMEMTVVDLDICQWWCKMMIRSKISKILVYCSLWSKLLNGYFLGKSEQGRDFKQAQSYFYQMSFWHKTLSIQSTFYKKIKDFKMLKEHARLAGGDKVHIHDIKTRVGLSQQT